MNNVSYTIRKGGYSVKVDWYGGGVQKKIDRGMARGMQQVMGWIMTTSKRSMGRIRKKVSPPGKPPTPHKKVKSGIRYIRFKWYKQRRYGIVGPVKFSSKSRRIVTRDLEYGTSPYVTTLEFYTRNWMKIDQQGTVERRKRNKKTGKLEGTKKRRKAKVYHLRTETTGPTRIVRIKKRPYMIPALMKAIKTGAVERIFTDQINTDTKGTTEWTGREIKD